MLVKPILLPAWVAAMMALASGIVITGGILVSVALWQSFVMRPSVLSRDEITQLREMYPEGRVLPSGAYRVCINRQEWLFYPSGLQGTSGNGCWR